MATLYASVNARCTCTDKLGLLTATGIRQEEYELLLLEHPNSIEILRRMGLKWVAIGVSPGVTSEELSIEKLNALLTTEEMKNRFLELSIKSSLLPVEVLDRMGVRRMCCREVFLNQPMIPFIDRSSGAYSNFTSTRNPIIRDSEIPTPKRPVPALPSLM